MRNRKMLIAGLITVVMGISIVGCGNDGKSTRETESTEQVTETEMATEEESEAEDTGDAESDDSYADETDYSDDSEESTEFTMPVYEDFTLASGLSENYADLDNRSFVYNGKKFTLGESTLKDLIDGGIPFEQNSLNNSGNNVNKNYETDRYTAEINDYVTMQFMFGNFTDGEQKAEISEMMLDGAKQVNFSFPTTITKDQLLEKCSENAEVDGKIVKYSVDSEVYMGSSGYTFEFDDTTGQLKEVRISWLP